MRNWWAVLGGLLALVGAGPARAGGAVQCTAEVAIVAASAKRAPLPKKLEKWRDRLSKPPFSSFHGFHLLGSVSKGLVQGKKVAVPLAGPYSMEITLLEVLTKKSVQYRFRLVLQMKKKARVRILSRSTLRLERGGTFFVAGPKLGPKTLILGITLK